MRSLPFPSILALILILFSPALIGQDESADESPEAPSLPELTEGKLLPNEPMPDPDAPESENPEAPTPDDSNVAPRGVPRTGGELVERWLESYSGLERIEVGFTQERKLKTLRLPIKSSGWMWMDINTRRFRWQVGDPPKTFVVGDGQKVAIAQPKRMKVRYREMGGAASSEGAPPGFAMMADGFPRTMVDFQKEYHVLKVVQQPNFYEVHVQPIQGEMAQGVKQLIYLIDLNDYFLRGFDIKLRDGSHVRSEFFHVRRNPPIDPRRFVFDPSGYTEVEEDLHDDDL